jgi:hypothetical protein
MEGPHRLIDWGVNRVPASAEGKLYAHVAALIQQYEPALIVLEDCSNRYCRRGARSRGIVEHIGAQVRAAGVHVEEVPWNAVRRLFARRGAWSKQEIANVLGKELPALEYRTPPVRKAWMSEDARMAMFDAVAMAYVVYASNASLAWRTAPDSNS